MKNIICVITVAVCSVFYSSLSLADKERGMVELDGVLTQSIKISSDGTGIVKDIECEMCTSKVATIDRNTRIYINGRLMNNINVKNARKKEEAIVVFNAKTNKVIVIEW